MKMLAGIFTFALSFSALALSVETKTFVYDGSQNSTELTFKGEQTHTEYRVEDIRTTCYRSEIVGYTTICTGGGYGPGYPGPGYPYPGPHRPYPGGYYPGPVGGYRSCYQQPIYRSVPYSCTQTVRTPYQVKDYDVDARVIVDVTNLSSEVTPGEKINVTLMGDSLSFEAVGSKKFFVVQKHKDIRSVMNGSVKVIDAVLAVELVEAAPILKSIKVSNIQMKDRVLNMDIGEVSSRENLDFDLKIVKNKALSSDEKIFDRGLLANEVNVAGSKASVDINALNVVLPKGKLDITGTVKVKTDGKMLNASQFKGQLEASRTLILRIR